MVKNFSISIIIVIFFSMLTTHKLVAQKLENGFGAGFSVATNGIGGNIYWLPVQKWKIGINGEYMPKITISPSIKENNVTVDIEGKFKTGGVFLTGSYQILKWMYATAGAGFSFFGSNATGKPKEMKYGDIVLKPETIGEISLNVKPGARFSPYAAIGFGKQAAFNKRFAFGVEVGAYYMDGPKLDIKASGMLLPTQDPEHVKKLQDEFSQFKFYPMVKLNLSVKIF